MSDPPALRPSWPIGAAGVLALAVAMGIGRFAFTPLMPLMMRDGLIDAAVAAELATANYVGYLLGAMSAARLARRPLRLLKLSLAGVCVLTLAASVVEGRIAWAALRLAAGVCSAWVLVSASSWCLRELAERAAGRRGAVIYSGVGIGIAAAGVVVLLGSARGSALLWRDLGLLAAAATVAAWWLLGSAPEHEQTLATGQWARGPLRHGGLVACYGAFGFGYIVPATYLPALARSQVDNPWLFGLAWPLFGAAAAASVAVATHRLASAPRREVWALAQGTMAAGTLMPLVSHALWSLALAAILVGGTFMVATMAGLQLARELEPSHPAPLLARLTSAFAAGQIAGPLLLRLIAERHVLGLAAADQACALATLLLAASALWLWRDPARRAVAFRPGAAPRD